MLVRARWAGYPRFPVRLSPPNLCLALLLGVSPLATGCSQNLRAVPAHEASLVDRRSVEFPSGVELSVAVNGLDAPTALAADQDGRLYIADKGRRGQEVRIQRYDPETGRLDEIYPRRDALGDLFANVRKGRNAELFGPVGGLLVDNGELFVTARARDDSGLVVALELDGWDPETGRATSRTVVGQLPAQGDYGVTDLAMHPINGRLYFGVGSATNSGVVGLDNWAVGWVRDHRQFADRPLTDLKIAGYRFNTPDPAAGLLNPEQVNTAPFNPFATSNQRIKAAGDGKPTSAIYSVDPGGGDLRVEAHGIRMPAGLAFNDFANLYAANQGMELRGTRPVKDDPDSIVRIYAVDRSSSAQWYGFPDFSTDFRPVTAPKLQPSRQLLERSGYSELSFLIDHDASGGMSGNAFAAVEMPGIEVGLREPDASALLGATLPPLSGATGLAFVPDSADAFDEYAGQLIVALKGDRAPFSTSGIPLKGPLGREVVAVDLDRGTTTPILTNASNDPGQAGRLHRPIDVTFDENGVMWVLDLGELRMRDGDQRIRRGTGRLYRLGPTPEMPTTQQEPEADTSTVEPM